jgi:type IV secretion system protein VirB5
VRVQKLEDLVRAIGVAGDPKAIADLNARIAGEQALLQNQLIQLEALRMVQRAQEEQLSERQSDALFQMGKEGIPKVVYPQFGQQQP